MLQVPARLCFASRPIATAVPTGLDPQTGNSKSSHEGSLEFATEAQLYPKTHLQLTGALMTMTTRDSFSNSFGLPGCMGSLQDMLLDWM